jgi:hypothetical protein
MIDGVREKNAPIFVVQAGLESRLYPARAG